jgi:hypothetical protein
MGKRLTTEEFIKMSTSKFGNKFGYSLVCYKDAKIPIKLICKSTMKFLRLSHVNTGRLGTLVRSVNKTERLLSGRKKNLC